MTGLDRNRASALSVPEMLRIMDVATALRQDRELVEEQLNVEALKERLKERMLAASKVTGEAVTAEEVDAAIKRYYASLHTFHEPKLSFPVAMAHLWVRRIMIGWLGGATLVSVSLLWSLYLSPNALLSTRGQNHRLVKTLSLEVASRADAVKANAKGRTLAPEVARLADEAEDFSKKDDLSGLQSVLQSLNALDSRLRESKKLSAEVASRADVVKALAKGRSVPPEVARLVAEAENYSKNDDPKGLETVLQSLNGLESRLRAVDKLKGEIADLAETVPAIAIDKKVAPEVTRLAAEAEVYGKKDEAQGLASVRDALVNLRSRLSEEYAVTAVSRDTFNGRNRNTIDHFIPDPEKKEQKFSAHYLFVQAKKADGTILTRRIYDNELYKDKDVTVWAERIPDEVFERLRKDKLADGILNETAFAVKRKGMLDEEITMPGADGKPLARLGRITQW
jgi:Family of unknown function (DUF6384)